MTASPLPIVSSELIARLEQALVDAEGEQFGPQSLARIGGATVVRELPAYRRSALVQEPSSAYQEGDENGNRHKIHLLILGFFVFVLTRKDDKDP